MKELCLHFEAGEVPHPDTGSAKKKRVSTRKRSHRRPMIHPPAVTGSMLMGPTEVLGRYERGRASRGPHAMPTALEVTKAVHHRHSFDTHAGAARALSDLSVQHCQFSTVNHRWTYQRSWNPHQASGSM